MRILQLTKKFPFPLKDGESIAVTNLSKSLKALGCEITLLSMNTVKHYVNTDSLPDTFDHYKRIYTVELDNRVTVFGALKNLFTSDSYHVCRFYYEEFRLKLVELLKQDSYDIIQLETLYLAPYIDLIRTFSNAKIVMRSHNVEFEIWDRITENTTFLPKKLYIRYLAKKLRRFELDQLDKYDALVTVTQRDLNAYINHGFKGKGLALPIGIDTGEYVSNKLDFDELSISFIGSLDWLPNLEGLNWFLEEVWPEIRRTRPKLKLHIAGRNTPDSIRALANDSIVVEGEVEDAHKFINQHAITIVPLLSGSGMRVKILEGMALGRVVISTQIGMEGIDAHHKEDILVADSEDEFIQAIQWIMNNEEAAENLAIKAKAFIKTNFDREVNARKLMNFLTD